MSKENEDILEKIIAMLPGHIYWKDKDCIYLGCNDAQAKSLGLTSRHNIVGKSDFDLPWKEQATKIREADLRVINNAESITVEEPAELTDGTLAIFLSRKEPLRDSNGNVIGVLGVSVDITKMKEYQEKIIKANHAKSNFLRIVAHELTAPTSNIINSLDIVKELVESGETDKKAIFEYLDVAKQQAGLIKPKINDVINYINFDAKDIVSEKTTCNIEELIERIIEKNISIKQNGVKISWHVDSNLIKPITIDATHLYLILNILINNAIKYTQQGSISVNVEKHVDKSKNDFIKVVIKDTGPGIHEEQLNAILRDFDSNPFDMVTDLYRKPSVRLPYAKLLIQHILHGEITISSILDKGTSITIQLPYESNHNNAATQNNQKNEANLSTYVLLVEDNDISRRLESDMLSKLGFIVETAASGKEALTKAKTKQFDFIFLDITLPDINGMQVFKLLQETLCAATPVVALTSHATEEDIDNFTNEGMLTVIAKPVNSKSLKEFFDSYNKSLED